MSFDVSKMSARECRDRMVLIDNRCQELEGYGSLSRVQESEFASLRAEFAELEVQERHAARALAANVRGQLRSGTAVVDRAVNSDGSDYVPVDRKFGDNLQDKAKRAIDHSFKRQGLPDHAAEAATSVVTKGPKRERDIASKWAVNSGSDAYLRAFSKLISDPDKGHLLFEPDELHAYQRASETRAAMSLTDSAGGYLIPLSVDPSIMLTNAGSNNAIRQIARVETIATDVWYGVTSAGATSEWKVENAQAADGSPTLGQPSVPVYLADTFVQASYEIVGDGLNFVQELGRIMKDSVDNLHNVAFTTGTGVGQPTGFVTALDGTSSEIAPTTAEVFATADVFKLQNSLGARWQSNAKWLASLTVINYINTFETTAGQFMFANDLTQDRLLRKPIFEASNMDSVLPDAAATADNFLLAYGDWSNYVIADRIGSTLETIPNLVGANGRPTGQRGFILWTRTGGDSVNDAALKVLSIPTAA